MSRLKRAALAAAAVAIAGCTADSPLPVGPEESARLVIADAPRGGPVAGFYFLPPMVKAPSFSGVFDPAVSPRVTICELAAGACVAPVAVFTTSSGAGSEQVTVDPAGEEYGVNWHTRRFSLDPAKHYRITVDAAGVVLGFADVDLVASGNQLKGVDTRFFVPVLNGRTLPIKFRIETGIAGSVVVAPDSAVVEPGQTQAFTATVRDLHGAPLPGAPVAWTTSHAATATISGTGVATGVAPGTATVTATSGTASGTATLRVAILNTAPVAAPDTFDALGNVSIPVPAPGLLANDVDGEGNPLLVVAETVTTAAGGTATLAADGGFTYRGAPGFAGSDSFSYTVTDGSLTATATATLSVTGRVWFVRNDAAAPGDGRDASPFATLKQAEAASAPGETLFVLAGDGTPAGLDEGIVLRPGQVLTGQGVAADVTVTVNGVSVLLLDAGAAPKLTRATPGTTVRLATGNTVQGVDIASTAGAGIAGTGFGLFTAARVSVTAVGGPALELVDGQAAASFGALSSLGSAGAGLRLVNVDGALTVPDGSLANAATAAVEIAGGDAVVELGATLVATAGRSVSVTGRTGGTVTMSGTIEDTGRGIRVQGNSGGSVAFTGASKSLSTGAEDAVHLADNGGASVSFAAGGLVITTTSGTGFHATGGGTVSVTGAGNTLSAAGGTALRMEDSWSGTAGITFRSISADGGAHGVVLRRTGTLNGVQVTGAGTSGSGGTIRNTTGAGIVLDEVRNIRFDRLAVEETGASGISGTAVDGFAFTNGVVRNSGTAGGADAANLSFRGSTTDAGVTGTVTIRGNVLAQALRHGVEIRNGSGTIALLDVSDNAITSSTSSAASLGAGIWVEAGGDAGGVASVARATITGNMIRNFPSDAGIVFQGGNQAAGGPAGSYGAPGSASQVVAITGNRIAGASAGTRMGTSAIRAAVVGRGQGNFDISGNGTAAEPLAHLTGTAISLSVLGRGTVAARIADNHVTAGNSFGSQGIGVGADNFFGSSDAPVLDASITGNVVSATDGSGILVVARNSGATLRGRVTANTVAAPLSGVRQGIRIDSGSGAGNTTTCIDLSGNASAGSGGTAGIGLRKQGTAPSVNAFGIVGLNATATPGVEAYVDAANPAGGGTRLLSATSGFTACTLP